MLHHLEHDNMNVTLILSLVVVATCSYVGAVINDVDQDGWNYSPLTVNCAYDYILQCLYLVVDDDIVHWPRAG